MSDLQLPCVECCYTSGFDPLNMICYKRDWIVSVMVLRHCSAEFWKYWTESHILRFPAEQLLDRRYGMLDDVHERLREQTEKCVSHLQWRAMHSN